MNPNWAEPSQIFCGTFIAARYCLRMVEQTNRTSHTVSHNYLVCLSAFWQTAAQTRVHQAMRAHSAAGEDLARQFTAPSHTPQPRRRFSSPEVSSSCACFKASAPHPWGFGLQELLGVSRHCPARSKSCPKAEQGSTTPAPELPEPDLHVL